MLIQRKSNQHQTLNDETRVRLGRCGRCYECAMFCRVMRSYGNYIFSSAAASLKISSQKFYGYTAVVSISENEWGPLDELIPAPFDFFSIRLFTSDVREVIVSRGGLRTWHQGAKHSQSHSHLLDAIVPQSNRNQIRFQLNKLQNMCSVLTLYLYSTFYIAVSIELHSSQCRAAMAQCTSHSHTDTQI